MLKLSLFSENQIAGSQAEIGLDTVQTFQPFSESSMTHFLNDKV
jgi:hypothetical protein